MQDASSGHPPQPCALPGARLRGPQPSLHTGSASAPASVFPSSLTPMGFTCRRVGAGLRQRAAARRGAVPPLRLAPLAAAAHELRQHRLQRALRVVRRLQDALWRLLLRGVHGRAAPAAARQGGGRTLRWVAAAAEGFAAPHRAHVLTVITGRQSPAQGSKAGLRCTHTDTQTHLHARACTAERCVIWVWVGLTAGRLVGQLRGRR